MVGTSDLGPWPLIVDHSSNDPSLLGHPFSGLKTRLWRTCSGPSSRDFKWALLCMRPSLSLFSPKPVIIVGLIYRVRTRARWVVKRWILSNMASSSVLWRLPIWVTETIACGIGVCAGEVVADLNQLIEEDS